MRTVITTNEHLPCNPPIDSDSAAYVLLIFLYRYTPSMPRRQLFGDLQRYRCLESDHIYYSEHGDGYNFSNFVDLDWLSSSGNSCEEEPFERYLLFSSK